MSSRVKKLTGVEKVVPTICASHCGGSCLIKAHVKDGVITRLETDDGEEPQLRGCLRGRAYRQRVYAPDRILYPMKRIGERGEGKFKRISWNEALDTIAAQHKRVMNDYGPASVLYMQSAGDIHYLNNFGPWRRLLCLAGGYSEPVIRPQQWRLSWGITSFGQGCASSFYSYGTIFAANTRDDLVNSKLIIMWGWDPAVTISGPNTCWYLAQAKEAGARIVCVDPKYTDTAAAFADQWIPIRPGTDAAMLLAIAYVMIRDNLYDKKFINTYTLGFEQFKEYVLGAEDGVPKTPAWAEDITGVPSADIENLAKEFARTKPAALMAGISAGRTAYGEQYHRAAIALASMTANIGISGGYSAARAWESGFGGYPYQLNPIMAMAGLVPYARNPIEGTPALPKELHVSYLPEAILEGKAGGYPDYKMMYIVQSNWMVQFINSSKIMKAMQKLDFITVQEQFMTPTAKYADIILPVCTYLERDDITYGVGGPPPFVGMINRVIEPLGESKTPLQITVALAERMGITGFLEKSEEEMLKDFADRAGVTDYKKLKEEATYRFELPGPYVAFKPQIEDPANNPFPTPSGKIEIYSERWKNMNDPNLPSIPKYIETWESRNDPLAKKYPLQLINTHFKRRALSQFDNIPWLRELEPQSVWISSEDARKRNISDGDMVRVFNDRGTIFLPAKVTERILPGVVDVPHGAWYDPEGKGLDRVGSVNFLTNQRYSPAGGMAYNTGLVEIEKE